MRHLPLSLLILMLGACSSYAPDAGHEVVLVEKPLFFGHGGIDNDPVRTGRTFAALTTDGILGQPRSHGKHHPAPQPAAPALFIS